MKITYNQIKDEIKEVSLLIGGSEQFVPGILENFKFVLLPLVLYSIFFSLCPFGEVFDLNLWCALGVMSIFFWYFAARFFYGFGVIFSMLPKGAFEKYQVIKIVTDKARIYYIVWIVAIVIAGLLSVFTIFNVLSLAVITLLSTIMLGIAFNLDISRYQISGLFGALAAAKEKWNQ